MWCLGVSALIIRCVERQNFDIALQHTTDLALHVNSTLNSFKMFFMVLSCFTDSFIGSLSSILSL